MQLGKCGECGLLQMITNCPVQWYLKIVFMVSSQVKHRLQFSNNEVLELVKVLGLAIDPRSVTEDDMTLELLLANKEVTVTYDSHSGKVQGVQSSKDQ